ncbi:MAG: S-layer homology domain-containing protein [Oscillibacter sp.]|nr:S-layer homology domain-containing protein [Oscillibacter sp.]
MKRRIYAALLAVLLTLSLCPAALAEEIQRPAPLDAALETMLDEYFGTVLTRGIAVYERDYETFLDWMSEEVLQDAILRVEGLSEQEKTIDDVSFAVRSYRPDTGELLVDVTETVSGTSSVISHELRVRGDADSGWFIESDRYSDALIHDILSAEFTGGAAPEPSYGYPNTWTNTGNQAKDITQIALSQTGYPETGDNHTKYAVWFYGSNKSAAWCAIFISWCAHQAGVPTSALKKNALASGFSTSNMGRNSFGATPYAFGSTAAKAGDVAYIDNNNDNISNHVGLVYDADSEYVYTVEGNCSNKVIKRKYSAKTGRIGSSNTKIVFYARPNYAGSGPETQPPSGTPSTLAVRLSRDAYSIARGSSCDIGGTITSNYPLTSVTGRLDTGWSVNITDIGDRFLDIGTSRLNSFRGADLPAGRHTLAITAADSSGKTQNASISIEVYEAPDPEPEPEPAPEPEPGRITERFDFHADIRFPNRTISLYRAPGDEIPYASYEEASCVCDKGVKLTDNSIWFSVTTEAGGTYWVPYQYDMDVTPRVVLSPETLNIRIGETKTVSVEYSYSPDVRKISWDASGSSLVTFSETEIGISSGGYGTGKKDLRVSGRNEGTGVIVLNFYNAAGNTLSAGKLFFVTVQKTVSDEDMPVDVRDKNTYYYTPVRWAVEQNIVQTNEFWPLNSCSRGVAVLFLWRLAGSPAPSVSNPFTDVSPSDDYYHAVLWALEKGITNGTTATKFSPGQACNRGQIVTFLHRFAGLPSASRSGNPFRDVTADRFCYDAVNWASSLDVTQGYSDGTFRPQTVCNRAQIMTFLYRYATNS